MPSRKEIDSTVPSSGPIHIRAHARVPLVTGMHHAGTMTRERTTGGEGRVPKALLVAFAASGAAGLILEVIWSKALSTILGNSLFATATVVSAYLAGLAFGAHVLGPRMSRSPGLIGRYVRLELAVAVLGALSLPLLMMTQPVYIAVHRALAPTFVAFVAVRFALCFALLLLPTALMGATLPLLVARSEELRFGGALSRLYAANTLGAAVGTLLAAFVLIPAAGLFRGTLAAASANVSAAAIAWLGCGAAGRRAGDVVQSPRDSRGHWEAAGGSRPTRSVDGTLLLLVAASGCSALLLEIAWTRILTLIVGSSVYSFAIVLAFYLLGIAIGSAMIARWLPRLKQPLLAFATLQLILGLLVLTQLFVFPALPDILLGVMLNSRTTLARYLAVLGFLAALILVPPCLILGAAFPVAARLLHTSDAGRTTGLAYAVNTGGTIVGSLGAGFLLIPLLGSRATVLAGALLSIAIALVALVRAIPKDRRLAGLAGGAALAAAALALASPKWDPRVLTAGVYRPGSAQCVGGVTEMTEKSRSPVARAVSRDSLLSFREGLNATVSLHRPAGTEDLVLKIGGKSDASTGDAETQVLSGHFPFMFVADSGRTAVIGHGSGMTLESILAEGARSVEVIEIEEAVLAASRWFHRPDADPLDDPRVRVILEDGRTHLAVSRALYDVIVSEPSNPWVAGNNNLFTLEFYRLVRSRLAAGGVFVQWVQLYELSPQTLASLLTTFRSVFPEAYVFLTLASDLVLVATPPGASARMDRAGAPGSPAERNPLRLDPRRAAASHYACMLSELPEQLLRGPRNTDDRPIVEYRAPIDCFRVGRRAIFEQTDVAIADQIPRSPRVPFLPSGDSPGMAEPDDRSEEEAIGIEMARLMGGGRAAEAEQRLREQITERPDNAGLLFHLGLLLMQTNRAAEADSVFVCVVEHGGGTIAARALNNRGILAMRRRDPEAGLAFFRAAEVLEPTNPEIYHYEARALAGMHRREESLSALRRGLEACPGDPSLLVRRAQMMVRPVGSPAVSQQPVGRL